MSTLVDRIKSAALVNGNIVIALESGEEVRFPASASPRLIDASEKELQHIEISPFGLHWPLLVEDLSLRGIRRGEFGRRVRRGSAATR